VAVPRPGPPRRKITTYGWSTRPGWCRGWLTGGRGAEHLPIKRAELSRLPRGWSRRQRRGAAAPRLVSAHQSGSSITTDSSHRLPASPWPAETGAPRRNRTYNPLAGSRVISRPPSSSLALVRAGTSWYGSCAVMAGVGPKSGCKRRPKRRLDQSSCDLVGTGPTNSSRTASELTIRPQAEPVNLYGTC